jgi:hypothetical protein
MATPELFSKSLHFLSWTSLVLCALATAAWVAIVADGNYCWSAFGFMMIGGHLSAASLFLVVLPSAVLYVKSRNKRDLWSLWLGGCSFLIPLAEIVLVVWVIPQRGE